MFCERRTRGLAAAMLTPVFSGEGGATIVERVIIEPGENGMLLSWASAGRTRGDTLTMTRRQNSGQAIPW